MVFHALMHDYDACENIFLKPSSSAKFRKKIIFHELLISCQFFNDFLIWSRYDSYHIKIFYAYYVNWWMVI